ncbi:MAG: hypothetical protein KGD63_11565 [Candidatus Lokiarchaeota archaeon]|nr:hypothetical protein [Candidatus Lokiarchaeota archaeon]
MESTYKNTLIQVVDLLESLEKQEKIKYYLVGGILVNLYSDFRITRDIDIALDLFYSGITIKEFINIIKEFNFMPIQDWNATEILAKETNIIQYLDKTETIRIDNHIIEKRSLSKYKRIGPLALKRRVREKLFGIECWIASKEDFILSKLVYGGWQDFTDALGCWMRFQGELNQQILEESSKELGILKEYSLLTSGITDPDEFFEEIHSK